MFTLNLKARLWHASGVRPLRKHLRVAEQTIRSRFMTREGSKALRRVLFQLLIGLRTPSQERSSVFYLFIKVLWITYGFVGGGGGRAAIAWWINLRFPFSNSRGPGVESQAHRLRFFRDE